MARQAGHTVVEPRPSLVPVEIQEGWCRKAMGLSLKNVVLTLTSADSRAPLFREMGEMLFTHFGVSGPLALSASAHIDGDAWGYTLQIDLKPALTPEQLDARLLRDFSENTNRDFANALSALLPRKLIGPVVPLSGVEPGRKVHQVTREERRRLAALLKELRLHPSGLRPIEEAIVTRGGVDVSQVNPSTMESKLLPGLFFAGELLDLDAYTGGFNLQIAFSTGFLAGMKCN
jgi:predicted Rossmann fold flavoprotein